MVIREKNVHLFQCFLVVPETKKRDAIFRLGNSPRVHLLEYGKLYIWTNFPVHSAANRVHSKQCD